MLAKVPQPLASSYLVCALAGMLKTQVARLMEQMVASSVTNGLLMSAL